MTLREAIGQLRTVLTAQARPYARLGSRSAIHKLPRMGPVAAGATGFAGDEQGDLRFRSGVDKAAHCYVWSHYAHWRTVLPPAAGALLLPPGAFGEDFSMEGLAEDQVCIGDVWQVGSARFEVSQGRQAGWKLNDRFGVQDLARQVQEGGRAGWYLRTTQPGSVRAGYTVWLLARPYPDWSIARLLHLISARSCDPRCWPSC